MKLVKIAGLLIMVINGILLGAGSDQQALELIKKADFAYTLEEKYDKALALLLQAQKLAESDRVSGIVLFETGYVNWLKFMPAEEVSDLLREAVLLYPQWNQYCSKFPKEFVRIIKKSVKKNRGSEDYDLRAVFLMDFLSSPDDNFAAAYGRVNSSITVKAGLRLHGRWFAWLGGGGLSFSGELEELNQPLQGYQYFAGGGIGYEGMLKKKLGFALGAGPQMVFVQEKSGFESIRQNMLGLKIWSEIFYRINMRFSAVVSLGYMMAGKEVNGVSIKPGGLSLGLGLGIQI